MKAYRLQWIVGEMSSGILWLRLQIFLSPQGSAGGDSGTPPASGFEQ